MFFRLAPGRGQRIGHRHHRIAVVGDEQRVRRGRAPAPRCAPAPARSAPYFSNATMRPPLRPTACLKARLHHIAIGIVGQQRGEGSLSDAGGVFDDPVDVGFRQEAQEIDAAAGDARIGRERDHRYAARARQLRGRRNRQRKQRTENDLGAFVERLLRALLRALRAAAVVLDQELDVRDSGIPPAPSRRRSSSIAPRRRHCRRPTAAGSIRP